MVRADDEIVPTYACLEPDGSITVEFFANEDDDAPMTARIPALDWTRRIAMPGVRREIGLDEDGNADHDKLRALVMELVARAEARRAELRRT